MNIFDVARYSPGVTYRSNDFNEGNANLAIRGFTISATPGNVQILRDGFHGPSIFDFTNISRVEMLVKSKIKGTMEAVAQRSGRFRWRWS